MIIIIVIIATIVMICINNNHIIDISAMFLKALPIKVGNSIA